MQFLKKILIIFILFLFVPFFFNKVLAVTFDLIAPDGPLTRGGNAQFTIYIDTEGSTVTTGQIGVNFDSQFLQFLSVTPGAAMTSATATPQGDKNLLVNGTNSSGFQGNNVFAYLTFKITASSPGAADLCSLWGPTPTPSPNVTGAPQPTGLPVTGAPQPTGLPETGDTHPVDYASLIGSILVIGAGGLLLLGKIIRL